MMKGIIDLHHDLLKGKSPGDIGSNPIREMAVIYNRKNSSAADPAVKDSLSRGISQSMKRKKSFRSRSSLASLPECWFGVDPVAGVEHS